MHIQPRLVPCEGEPSRAASGVFWSFDTYPSALVFLWYWGAAALVTVLLQWATGFSWLLTTIVVGALAAIVFWALLPLWQNLTFALRQRLALSRNQRMRKLSACNAHLIAYHRRPDGSITTACVMTFNHMLEMPPVRRRQEIRNAIRGLRASAQYQMAPVFLPTVQKSA